MSGYHERTISISLKEGVELDKATRDVIGYLSTWAIHSPRYAVVNISSGRDGEIHAAYREKEGGEVTFFMAAIKHDDGTYSTHS